MIHLFGTFLKKHGMFRIKQNSSLVLETSVVLIFLLDVSLGKGLSRIIFHLYSNIIILIFLLTLFIYLIYFLKNINRILSIKYFDFRFDIASLEF